MFPRSPRPVRTIDGDFDLNDYEVVATLPGEVQVRIANPEDLEALVRTHGDLPLFINPRPAAPGVIPAPLAPIFTWAPAPDALVESEV